MTGRNRMPRHHVRDGPQPAMNTVPVPMLFRPSALEDELERKYREMQQIISENRLILDENTHLQRELTATKDDIRRLRKMIPKLRADNEEEVRELIDRELKLEAELHDSEPLREEVVQLRAEVPKLDALRQELTTQVHDLKQDINRLQAENDQEIAMRDDINRMHDELVEARRAFEYEKKANEEQLEQKQVMEHNLLSLAREIEKLRAQHMIAERRAWGLGGPDYGMLNGSSGMIYPGGALGLYGRQKPSLTLISYEDIRLC